MSSRLFFPIPIVNCANWKGIFTCGKEGGICAKYFLNEFQTLYLLCCTVVEDTFNIPYVFVQIVLPNQCQLKLVLVSRSLWLCYFFPFSYFLPFRDPLLLTAPISVVETTDLEQRCQGKLIGVVRLFAGPLETLSEHRITANVVRNGLRADGHAFCF